MKQKIESIGSRLKKARSKENLSLDEVYGKTRIHPGILEALEQDRADELLSPVYIKSFLKTYSHYLGLDNDQFVKKVLAKSSSVEYSPPAPVEPVLKEQESYFKIDIKRYLLPLVAGLSIAFLVSVIGFAGFKLVSGFRNLLGKTHVASSGREAPVSQSPKPAFLTTIPKNEGLVLELKTFQDVWIEVKSDGKILFRHILPKKSLETWKADDSIELWLGKAEAVELTLNGQSLGSPGKGVIRNIKLTREGMSVGR